MSFISSAAKPKLVEGKLLNRISRVQKIIQEQNKTWIEHLGDDIWAGILNNIGGIIILIIILVFLVYRYCYVQMKKKEKKKN